MEYEHVASFGELLKALRKQKHIGQQQVAEQMAVHRNTIGAWERGDRLPDTRGTVLELARCLHLDEQETARLLEASLTGVATRWNVPYRRNPFFTGREELMQRLHTLLCQEKAAALTQSLVLSGMGGIGKTQMAVEYAYRYGQQYASILWLNADTMESILSSYSALAALLELPEQQESDQQKVVAAVNRWLCTHRDWLLIVDNVEERERIASVLPTSPEGSLLFTTRRQALGTLAYPLEVERMSQEEGIRFLLHRSRRLSLEEPLDACSFAEVMEAGKIVAEMEGLPLALDQAGAYIEETQCSLQDYLQLFQAHRAVLLGQRGRESTDHPETVATTLSLSITAIAQQHPAAVELLRVCALLHPDGIPEELFLESGSHLGPTLAAACADMLSWNRLIASVSSYSLIKRQPREKTLSMHRLVQAVLQDGIEEAERRMWVERLIVALNRIFPEVELLEDMQQRQDNRLLPHVLACITQASSWQHENLDLASILFKAAAHSASGVQFTEAEALYQQAWRIWKQVLGPEHQQVAYPLYGLAKVYGGRGKYAEAEVFYQQAKRIWEQTLGSDHRQIVYPLYGLAKLYVGQGKYAEAEVLYQRAKGIWERELGPEHPHMAYLFSMLADLYLVQRKYAEAEQLYQQALFIQEQALGPENPIVALSLSGLAILAHEQEKYAEAEAFCQRAWSIWERALGPEHPNVAMMLHNLGEIYRVQGKHVEAESFYQRAWGIWERALGPKHPSIICPLHGLALLYHQMGKYAEAEDFFQRAFALQTHNAGIPHSNIAELLQDFATFRRAQGKIEEAVSFYGKALIASERALGANHPKTQQMRENYIALLREMGRQEEADALEAGLSDEVETQ